MSKKINKIQHGLQTTAIHAGEFPDPSTGASAPNLVMSSTFVTDEATGFSARDLDETSGYLYTRWSNPTVHQLEQKLCALEGSEACLCFGSLDRRFGAQSGYVVHVRDRRGHWLFRTRSGRDIRLSLHALVEPDRPPTRVEITELQRRRPKQRSRNE